MEKLSLEHTKRVEPNEEERYDPIFDTPEKIQCIKQRTNELIDHIFNGRINVVIFLDRSARPLSWMLDAAWNLPKREKPITKFVNIGREKGEVLGWGGMPPSRYDYENEDEWKKEVEKYWSELDSTGYIKKVKKDFVELKKKPHKEKLRVLLVDDFASSNFSINVARDFFEHHFPKEDINFHIFFEYEDVKIFNKEREGWQGLHLPWNTDKSYTMLAEELPENINKVTAMPERDIKKRSNALALKKEIKEIFTS